MTVPLMSAARPALRFGRNSMKNDEGTEERVNYRERYQGIALDFRGRPIFVRYDCCQFVKCAILIDEKTESLAFTGCEFEDCNIDELRADGQRGLMVRENIFKRPIEERRVDFEKRLTDALAARRGDITSK
jgi:hypothetical protein